MFFKLQWRQKLFTVIRHDQVVANSLEFYYDTRCGYNTVSEKNNVISNTKYFSAMPRKSWRMMSYEKSQPRVKRLVCSSSCFPCVGVRLIFWSLRSTVTFVICFHRSLLLAFSLHFLPPLPFSNLSSHSPPILAVVFLVFWNLAFCLGSFR